MSSRVRKTGDKNQQILKALLKEPGNSHCSDCKTASHPRWASWNLGIFICIRCSGIHRSMGTHISRVKSVDLDTWTDEQVASMVKWGNLKANKFWESKLPNNNHIPDDSKIENFIRTKYEMKKWSASSTIPDPSTLSVDQQSSNIHSNASTSAIPKQSTSKSDTTNNRRSLNSSLLDLEFGSPIAAPRQSSPRQSSQQEQQQHPKQVKSTINELSSTLTSPPPQQAQQSQHRQHQHHHQQQSQSQQRPLNTRPDLKKSILSLYSTPIASNSTPNFPANSHTIQQSNNFMQNQSTSSLNGLNFNNTSNSWNQSTNNNLNNGLNGIGGINTQNQWSNTTNSTPTNAYSNTSSNPLDDDLFKNVWK